MTELQLLRLVAKDAAYVYDRARDLFSEWERLHYDIENDCADWDLAPGKERSTPGCRAMTELFDAIQCLSAPIGNAQPRLSAALAIIARDNKES